jgi:aminocarboxymuconate-semialdehyde decarboxylase
LSRGPAARPGVDYARALNEHGARVASQGQGRLELMATLALAEPDKCAYELERCGRPYGARSALLPYDRGRRRSTAPNSSRSSPRPRSSGCSSSCTRYRPRSRRRFPLYGVQVLVQWPFETTLAVTRLIFEGVLDRHPNLKLLLAHGGGNLIFLKGRLNSAYEAEGWEADPYYRKNVTRAPGDYFDRIYFDTCALSPESVEFTIKIAGADRVMFGTDYPFDIGDPEAKRALPALNRLDEASKRRIFRENAESVCPPHANPARPSPRSAMKKATVESRAVRSPVAGFPVATRAGRLLFISGARALGEGGCRCRATPSSAASPRLRWDFSPRTAGKRHSSRRPRASTMTSRPAPRGGRGEKRLLFYSIYAREMRNFPVIARTRAALFEGGVAPPSTASQVPACSPGAVVYFDPSRSYPIPRTAS